MDSRSISLALIETVPMGQKGSMARYADLLESGLDQSAGIVVSRINLALSQHLLSKVPGRFRMWVHHGWIWLTARFRLQRQFDLFHLLDGSHGYVARWLPSERTIVTAHDVIPLLHSKRVLEGGIPGRGSRMVIHAAINGLKVSRRIICVSQSTMHDLQCHAGLDPERMTVISPALSEDVTRFAGDSPPWHLRRDSDLPYVLHLGHNGFYKNRAGVLRIFAAICKTLPEMTLKLAGPPPDENVSALAERLELTGRIEYVVNPDDAQVADLYRHASLLLFPSLYEGFGWPPLEAMAFGCPVVCSTEGSLSEVVAEAALTAPAVDEAALAGHCLAILENETVAEEMIGRGLERVRHFQPDRMVDELMTVYRQVAG